MRSAPVVAWHADVAADETHLASDVRSLLRQQADGQIGVVLAVEFDEIVDVNVGVMREVQGRHEPSLTSGIAGIRHTPIRSLEPNPAHRLSKLSTPIRLQKRQKIKTALVVGVVVSTAERYDVERIVT
jgi:hypothetical protein